MCMMSMMYQAYQNHMDLTSPWRTGAAAGLKYLNLVPQGVSDKLFGRLAASLELISRSSLTYHRPAYGIDKVMVYRLDAGAGKLFPHDHPYAALPAGHGPRHFDFHPNGRFFYVINELGSTVTVFAYDADLVKFAEIQTISTLPVTGAVRVNARLTWACGLLSTIATVWAFAS